MGSKTSHEKSYLKTYSTLVNMGINDDLALSAANKYGDNINRALDWIQRKQELQKKAIADDICDGGDIAHCIALERTISVLKYYRRNYENFVGLNKYLAENKQFILSDYHHILDKHLSEDRRSKLHCDKQFGAINHSILKEHGLRCDVKKCKIFLRNNRDRDIEKNTNCDDQTLSVYIDIIDTIHCYFMHSVDIGYRIIQFTDDYKDQSSEQLARIQRELSTKREFLQKVRGKNKVLQNRFTTKFNHSLEIFVHFHI